MYQPRRLSDVVTPDCAAPADNAARRAARTKMDTLRTRVAPTAVSVALLAGVTAFTVQLKVAEGNAISAVPAAPVRADDTTSRDAERTDLVDAAELVGSETVDAAEIEVAEEATKFALGSWTSGFGAAAGEKYAQSSVVVRVGADKGTEQLAALKSGDKVAVTDLVVDGYRQVTIDSKLGYVIDSKLGDNPPVVKPTAGATGGTGATGASTMGGGSAPVPTGKSVLGLKPKAMVVYNAVTARWSFKSIGGYRKSSLSNHQYGGAIDFMLTPGVDSGKGWEIAKYLVANASEFGIDHIIFEQKIWTPRNPNWRGMANRGSITANHYDHVHVSVKL